MTIHEARQLAVLEKASGSSRWGMSRRPPHHDLDHLFGILSKWAAASVVQCGLKLVTRDGHFQKAIKPLLIYTNSREMKRGAPSPERRKNKDGRSDRAHQGAA
jgi:hypothetical protein